MMKRIILLLTATITACFHVQCNENLAQETSATTSDTTKITKIELALEEAVLPLVLPFDRTEIIKNIKQKINDKLPLVVHLYVPLCDNINQGIVPTTASLGDGMSLRSNLYWATSGGSKKFFQSHPQWKQIYNKLDVDANVLERVVFVKTYKETTIYLVADAYRGDRMEETVNDFLASVSFNRMEEIVVDSTLTIAAAGNADLFLFNGHNGMMDAITLKPWVNKTDKKRDVVLNSCVSYEYMEEELLKTGGYPLVRTQTLLYPGAYVLAQIIDDWVSGVDEKQLCLNAGAVYCQKHKCGAGTKVYKAGFAPTEQD